MFNHNLREKKRLQDFLLEKYNSRSGKPIPTLVKKAETPSFDPLRRVMRLYVSLYEEAERLTRYFEKLEKKASVDISGLSPVQDRVRVLLINAIAAYHTTDANNLRELKEHYLNFLNKLKTDLASHLKLSNDDPYIHLVVLNLDRYVRDTALKLSSGDKEVKDAIEKLRDHTKLIENLVKQDPNEAVQTLENYVHFAYSEKERPPAVGTTVEKIYPELRLPPEPKKETTLSEIYHRPFPTNLHPEEAEKIVGARNLLAKQLLTGDINEIKELLKNPRSTDIKYPYPEGLPWHGWALGIGAGLLGLMGLLDLFQRRRKTPGLLMTLLGLLGLAAWGLYYKPQSFLGINLDPMWRELQKNYPSIFNLFGSSDQKATA
jgi:hypothetical protein